MGLVVLTYVYPDGHDHRGDALPLEAALDGKGRLVVEYPVDERLVVKYELAR